MNVIKLPLGYRKEALATEKQQAFLARNWDKVLRQELLTTLERVKWAKDGAAPQFTKRRASEIIGMLVGEGGEEE